MTLTDLRRPPSLGDEQREEQLVPRSGSELTQQLLELVQFGDLESSRETEPGGFEIAVRIVEIDSQDRRQLGLCLRHVSKTAALV